jgi:hypothetical protein
MKNLLIIYPHWHPVNLAGVHRPRLVGNFLKEFGWQPIVLTVDEKCYEEKPDPDFVRTFSDDFEVVRVNAFPVTKPRLIGDIGLRAFFQLYKGALDIIRTRQIDFIWIPIPSFYCALLGRFIHNKTNVPYGIDYIDPWVRDISSRRDWRHRVSNLLARLLEPVAVKKASLITGVSYEYFLPVLDRNFTVTSEASAKEEYTVHHMSFPYGFDPNDHKIKLTDISFPWSGEKNVLPWIYAGAFLPNSRLFVMALFKVIAEIRHEQKWNERIRLYFIGTGSYPGKSIMDYASEAGIEDIIAEDRNRYPYLHVLNFLSAAHTVMVIGSTEKHYTASKVYQALLSEQPVWAVFHEKSTAVQVMQECSADQFLVKYSEGMAKAELKAVMKVTLLDRLSTSAWEPDLKTLAKYSARESAGKLVEGIEAVLSMKHG